MTKHGSSGDRALALRDLTSGRIASCKRCPRLLEFRAVLAEGADKDDPGRIRIEGPDGISLHADDPTVSHLGGHRPTGSGGEPPSPGREGRHRPNQRVRRCARVADETRLDAGDNAGLLPTPIQQLLRNRHGLAAGYRLVGTAAASARRHGPDRRSTVPAESGDRHRSEQRPLRRGGMDRRRAESRHGGRLPISSNRSCGVSPPPWPRRTYPATSACSESPRSSTAGASAPTRPSANPARYESAIRFNSIAEQR
jgi:hypothetical protein